MFLKEPLIWLRGERPCLINIVREKNGPTNFGGVSVGSQINFYPQGRTRDLNGLTGLRELLVGIHDNYTNFARLKQIVDLVNVGSKFCIFYFLEILLDTFFKEYVGHLQFYLFIFTINIEWNGELVKVVKINYYLY